MNHTHCKTLHPGSLDCQQWENFVRWNRELAQYHTLQDGEYPDLLRYLTHENCPCRAFEKEQVKS